MKVAKFSLYMLKKEKRKALFYMITCTFSVVMMFLFLNIIYNPNYYGGVEAMKIESFNKIFSIMLSYLVIVIVVAMNFYAYNFYLSSQTKEIGIYLLGGSKLTKLFVYLVSQNTFIYLVSLIIGIILGYGLVPIVNYMIVLVLDANYPIFVYSSTALWGTVGLTLVCLFYLAVVATGFIYRHEIKELIGMKKEMQKKDERILPLGPTFYLFLMILPLAAFIFVHDAQTNAVFSFIAVIAGFKGFCRYTVPRLIEKLQKSVLLEHKIGLISSGNFHQMLVQSCSSIQIFLIICLFMNAYMIGNVHQAQNLVLIFVAYVSLMISVSMAIGYKILLEVNQRAVTFSHLHKLGYTKQEIVKMIRQEMMLIFGFAFITLFLYVGMNYLPYVFSRYLSLGFMMINIAIFTLAIIVTGIISYRAYKKIIMKGMA